MRRALMALGAVSILMLGGASVAAGATTFSSANDDVRCQAGWVGQTTGVMCIRYSDDRGFILLPTRFRDSATVTHEVPFYEVSSGRTLWPGQSRTFRYPDASYRCTARSRSVIRCVYTKYGYGFTVGRGFLTSF